MKTCFAISAVALLSGCAQPVYVHEVTPVSARLGGTKSVAVAATSDPAIKNSDDRAKKLHDALADRLKSGHELGDVVDDASSAQVVLQCKIVSVDEGSQLARGLGAGGDSTVDVLVDVLDANKKTIGEFSATGSSHKNSGMLINGVNTDAIADTMGRAIDAASDHIVDYLKSKD